MDENRSDTPLKSRDENLHFQKDFTATELTDRRRRVMAACQTGFAIVAASAEVPGFDPVRQTNDFYYLTGVEASHCYLTMDAATGRSVLYLPPRNEKHEKSDGATLSDEDAAFILSRTGIEEVRPIAQLLTDVSNRTGTIWLMRSPEEGARQCQDTLRHYYHSLATDPLDNRPSRETHLLAKLAQLSPRAEFRDLSPIVHAMRLTKSPAEIKVMRASSEITALATIEAIKATRPGVTEYQLGAVAEYVYQANGGRGVGYRPIVATAANIWMMHYWRNNAVLQDGDLVLFDCAPDYNNYTSDIGRMWPVNGTYSPLQRELYGYVLKHHEVLLSLIRAGRTMEDIYAEAASILRPIIEATAWSKPIYKAAALKLIESKRPLSHSVGMAVHDAGNWKAAPMGAGLVFAVDPELVVTEEELYIRVEDTVLVTETGSENLTALCPREMADVEELMKHDGIIQTHPPVHQNPGR